jgi:transglutaminase-like putative cysteine protease
VNRKIVAIGIVGVWLLSAGVLGYRQWSGAAGEFAPDASLNVPPGAVYYAVELGGEQVGFASSTVDTVPEGIFVQEIMELRLPVGEVVRRVNRRTEAILDRRLNLQSFATSIHGDEGRALLEGTRVGDTVAVEVGNGQTSQTIIVPFTPRSVMPAFLAMKLTFGGELRTGAVRALAVANPVTLRTDSVFVTVLEDSTFMIPDSAIIDSSTMKWSPIHYDTVHAWRTQFEASTGTSDAWIDDLGRLVSLNTPQGFRITRSVYEVVYENFRRRDVTTVMNTGRPAADVTRQTPSEANLRPMPASELTVVFRGWTPTESVGYQTTRGDTVTVRTATVPEDAGYRLGIRSPRLASYLIPDAIAWSEDPRISAQARRVVGRTRNPVTATRELVAWVAAELESTAPRGFPNPLATMQERLGDENGVVTAFVSMARSVGIPTRPVGGVIYIGDTFYHHSWAEVFLGEWIPVDPVFGQFPADASHLRLFEGMNRLLEFARLTGDLQPEVIEVRR